jgi:hypothetical protein
LKIIDAEVRRPYNLTNTAGSLYPMRRVKSLSVNEYRHEWKISHVFSQPIMENEYEEEAGL